MKPLIFPAIAVLWILLCVQGCTDGGMAAENLSCTTVNPESETIQQPQKRNTAMSDNISKIADGPKTQAQAAAVRKLETATFALG